MVNFNVCDPKWLQLTFTNAKNLTQQDKARNSSSRTYDEHNVSSFAQNHTFLLIFGL